MLNSNKEKPPHLIHIKNGEYHQLHCDWSFYYLIPNKINSSNKNWNSYLKKLHDFNTFEDFWAIINSIEPASKLQKGCRYYIFKKSIQPLWEDAENTGGREISVQYRLPQIKQDQKNRHSSPDLINISKEIHTKAQEKWKKLVIAVLCNKEEYFHEKDFINGIEFNCRANAIKVGIWTKPIKEMQYESLKMNLLNILEYNENEDEIFKTEVIALEEDREEVHPNIKKYET